jgi:alpha-tubulin suppressor-like RCC1 family protein
MRSFNLIGVGIISLKLLLCMRRYFFKMRITFSSVSNKIADIIFMRLAKDHHLLNLRLILFLLLLPFAISCTQAYEMLISKLPSSISIEAGGINNSNKASYSVSGACSDSGGTVSLSIDSTVIDSTIPCNSDKTWSKTGINLSAVADGANVPIVATLFDTKTVQTAHANATSAKDVIAPTVTNVTSSTADGTYGTGSIISIQVVFSEPVIVTGAPVLILALSPSTQTATYTSGSGTNTLNFTYTAVSGQNIADLDYSVATALQTISGSTIKDVAGNSATLTLASPGAANSLGANKAIVIDTIAPTITNVTSSLADGTYGAGQVIPIQITFSKAVTVGPGSTLSLNAGHTGVQQLATYTSGSGTTTLTYSYTVASSDTTNGSKLEYLATNSFGGGSPPLKDAYGNLANLALPTPAAAGSLSANKNIIIDAAPAASVTDISSSISDGYYTTGTVISIKVTFSRIVNVITTGGTPLITINTMTPRNVLYSSGSGTNILSFDYTVVAGNNTSGRLDYINTGALTLQSGTIKDSAGNNATLTLPTPGAAHSLSGNKNIVIDTTAPTVTYVTSGSANGTFGFGSQIDIQVFFSENVTVTGTPTITLNTTPTNKVVSYTLGGGTNNALHFQYTVGAGESSADLDYITTAALILAGGSTIRDAAGNNAVITLPTPGAANSLGNSKNIVIDSVVPTITDVNSASSLTDGVLYGVGNIITIDVTFSETVIATFAGTPPSVSLNTTPTRIAVYVGTSGSNTTNKLSFTYTVNPGDVSSRLNLSGTSINLTGNAAIKDTAGNNITNTFPTGGATKTLTEHRNLMIDGSLNYPRTSYIFPVGADFSTLTSALIKPLAIGGTGTTYAISPNLTTNTGLSFNTSTGEIGALVKVPTSAVSANYTITASYPNGMGTLSRPVNINTINLSKIYAGNIHTCAIADGQVYCWGDNTYGQLGLGDTAISARNLSPNVVPNLSGITQLAVGEYHTCALASASGTIKCWGKNSDFGQLGIGNNFDSTTPINTVSIGTMASISSKANHTCAVKTDGSVYCWGKNEFSQIGQANSTAYYSSPVQTGSTWTSGISQVVAGGAFTLTQFCDTATPPVCGLSTYGGHTCSLTTGGAVQCLGNNLEAELGNASTTPALSVTPVATSPALTSVSQLSAASYSNCALKTDGTVHCWGNNARGQCGQPAANATLISPTQISGLTSVSKISAGTKHVCSIEQTTNNIKCWGKNGNGQLGQLDGTGAVITSYGEYSPLQVNGFTATEISAGAELTCALGIANKNFYCWGANFSGEIGNSSVGLGNLTKTMPVLWNP